MVAAWSGRDDHLEFARIVLAEYPADCGLEMTFLIEHRHDNRDAGPGCADSIPRGLHSIILFFLELLAHRAWICLLRRRSQRIKRLCSRHVHCSLRSLRLALGSRCRPRPLTDEKMTCIEVHRR